MSLERNKLAVIATTAAIALAVVACDTRGGRSGTRSNEVGTSTLGALFLDPGAAFEQGPVVDLFEVEADHAEYWRMFTLDRYDGESWTSTDGVGSAKDISLSTPAILPRSGSEPSSGAPTLSQTFRILSVDLGYPHALPMAQTAREISGPTGDITWDPALNQAFVDGALEAGMTYTVRSEIVVPTPEELDRVDFADPRTYGGWTQLPEGLDPRIEEIAGRWTADATSDYRKVLAIQQHFQNGRFVYSTDVAPAHDADALLEFLTVTRTGFCVQYSTAMAVMVRALGLPARIGGGYRPGIRQDDGSFLVRSTDAHVWVEVFFPGYGWLQFEPEAGTTHPNAEIGTYLNPVATTDR